MSCFNTPFRSALIAGLLGGFVAGGAGGAATGWWVSQKNQAAAPMPPVMMTSSSPSVSVQAPTLAAGGTVPSVLGRCERELKEYCSDVAPGGGRLKTCLLAQKEKLSADCKKEAEDLKVP